MTQRTRKTLLLGLMFSYIATTYGAIPFSERSDVSQFIEHMSATYHFKKDDLVKTLNQVDVREDIIQSMKHPYEKKPWNDYRSLFVTDKRINEGVAFWQQHEKTLKKAEKKFRVPKKIIVAILGIETNYGRTQGDYRVLDSLSTLAFNYPERARFFQKELSQFLLLCREHKIKPNSVYGSYAGAIGQGQFMPSSYRHYAVDFSGNGSTDLRKNTADAIGSVANYFKKHGWVYKAAVAEKPKEVGKLVYKLDTNAKRAKYTTKRLKQLGIALKTKTPPRHASLLKFNKTKGHEYWVGYPNFFVITRYNTSKQYALAVHLLANAIEKEVNGLAKDKKH